MVYAVGRALGDHLPSGPRRVVTGQDTRESSAWIADTLHAGLRESGVEVASAGVITTPGIAYLTHTRSFSAGVVISASHNPWQDNGIKIFGGDGYKLSDQTELEIEKEIFALLETAVTNGKKGKPPLPGDSKLHAAYVKWLSHPIPGAEKLTAVVDCANGAASAIAPEGFKGSGLRPEFTHSSPNGRHIHGGCGSPAPANSRKEV